MCPRGGTAAFFLISASVLALASCDGPAGRDRESAGPTGSARGAVDPPGRPGKLAGTAWSLAELEGRGLIGGTAITLNFRRDSLGANRVRTTDGKIETSALFHTDMACGKNEGGVMSQEQRYLRALAGAATYRVSGDRLEIRNDAGEKTLLFEKEAG